jgi:hypothetical protein
MVFGRVNLRDRDMRWMFGMRNVAVEDSSCRQATEDAVVGSIVGDLGRRAWCWGGTRNEDFGELLRSRLVEDLGGLSWFEVRTRRGGNVVRGYMFIERDGSYGIMSHRAVTSWGFLPLDSRRGVDRVRIHVGLDLNEKGGGGGEGERRDHGSNVKVCECEAVEEERLR